MPICPDRSRLQRFHVEIGTSGLARGTQETVARILRTLSREISSDERLSSTLSQFEFLICLLLLPCFWFLQKFGKRHRVTDAPLSYG